jgi:hypothetical protein
MGLFNNFGKKQRPKMKLHEILPANEMKQKYNLMIETYQPRPLDPKNVPEKLRDLVLIAQKWGIGDDIIREDLQKKASDQEKRGLKLSLDGRIKTISQWLDS